ncbi:MAG: type II secretion system F family protein [Candidatus Marsarchaeota archaeon]|nr:type II secretion system F family protein [Candidatus Marsarchaeota archaeon]
MNFNKLYLKISMLAPKSMVNSISTLMEQGGFTISPRIFIGFTLYLTFFATLASVFITQIIVQSQTLRFLIPAVVLISIPGLLYMLIMMTADNRARKIEELLPDALDIIAANIRAGMTLENAIWLAARPEFGPLRDEIKKISADTFGGKPIEENLEKMAGRVRSDVIKRAVQLIQEGIRLGGEMSKLLEEVAEDTRNTQTLKKQISTSTVTYTLFIIFAATIMAPLLFSISTTYSKISQNLMVTANTGNTGTLLQNIPFGGGGNSNAINPNDIFYFALESIIATNLLAGFIIGQIRYGKATRGVGYVPVLLIISVTIFLVTQQTLQLLVQGFIK